MTVIAWLFAAPLAIIGAKLLQEGITGLFKFPKNRHIESRGWCLVAGWVGILLMAIAYTLVF